MSNSPISHSDDLQRLWHDGYDIATDDGWLLVRQVPYVDASRAVQCGVLAVALNLAGEITSAPNDHQAYFSGSDPCNDEGRPLDHVINERGRDLETGGHRFTLTFSHKPTENGAKRDYRDYHELVSAYVDILSSYAQAVDPAVSPMPPVRLPPIESDYPFAYADTASARAEISNISRRLAGQTVGIIGLGGTGSHLVDLVAKTHVRELHLWDGDRLLQHNAFRSPGAAPIEVLRKQPFKCEYYRSIYSNIHTRIVAHPYYMEPDCLDELAQLDFAFLAVDGAKARASIIPALIQHSIPFIDTGIGLAKESNKLAGEVRTALVTESMDQERALRLVPMSGEADDDEYATNIQIADMNALNAVAAVIRWKKFMGVYADSRNECVSSYWIEYNDIIDDRDDRDD